MARTRSVESIRREIETLRRKEAALKAQAKEMEHRNKERRKLLVASVVLEEADRDAAFGSVLSRLLEQHVRERAERELLGLRPLEERAPEPVAESASGPEGGGVSTPPRA